jgi:hypothetical protein
VRLAQDGAREFLLRLGCRSTAALPQPDYQPHRFEGEEGEEQVEGHAQPAVGNPLQRRGHLLREHSVEGVGGQRENGEDDGQGGQPAPKAAGLGGGAHHSPPDVARQQDEREQRDRQEDDEDGELREA